MDFASQEVGAQLRKPVFIVSPPRSGSTLLFQTLAQASGLATIGDESHVLMESMPAFHPRNHGWTSNRMVAGDVDAAAMEELSRRFRSAMRDREGKPAGLEACLLEKTPKNSLRLPLFHAAWPDARFLFLYREARATLSSMIEAWQSGRFRTYPRLPGWTGLPWSLLLVPGWQELNGKPLPEIVARQWATTIDILLADLAAIPPEQVRAISYEHFLADPQWVMEQICGWLGCGWDRALGSDLPLSRYTVSRPAPDKWKRHETEIESVWPLVAGADARARAFAHARTF